MEEGRWEWWGGGGGVKGDEKERKKERNMALLPLVNCRQLKQI